MTYIVFLLSLTGLLLMAFRQKASLPTTLEENQDSYRPDEAPEQESPHMLECLKREVREVQEANDGYSFRFQGSDQVIDQIMHFVKTERQSGLFDFRLRIGAHEPAVWLDITGHKGSKGLIRNMMHI